MFSEEIARAQKCKSLIYYPGIDTLSTSCWQLKNFVKLHYYLAGALIINLLAGLRVIISFITLILILDLPVLSLNMIY